MSTEVLKLLLAETKAFLFDVVRLCRLTQTVPACWKESVTVYLYRVPPRTDVPKLICTDSAFVLRTTAAPRADLLHPASLCESGSCATVGEHDRHACSWQCSCPAPRPCRLAAFQSCAVLQQRRDRRRLLRFRLCCC